MKNSVSSKTKARTAQNHLTSLNYLKSRIYPKSLIYSMSLPFVQKQNYDFSQCQYTLTTSLSFFVLIIFFFVSNSHLDSQGLYHQRSIIRLSTFLLYTSQVSWLFCLHLKATKNLLRFIHSVAHAQTKQRNNLVHCFSFTFFLPSSIQSFLSFIILL